MQNAPENRKITTKDIVGLKKAGKKIVSISLYDALTARLADECGAHLLLVGDSLGMAVLGHGNTIPVTIDVCLQHCAAVARGAKNALVVGDMPFMTYQISPEQAMVNAARFLQEAGADGVKLEGGRHMAPTVRRLAEAGVPVMGHIGLLPQNILREGRYRLVGKTSGEREQLLGDAKALEDAGAFSLVLECVDGKVAGEITAAAGIPTIGIGAGPQCDGQIQVVNDLLGLTTGFLPKHAMTYCDLAGEIRKAFKAYARDVTGNP